MNISNNSDEIDDEDDERLIDEKRREQQQQQQQSSPKESSWLDGIELEKDHTHDSVLPSPPSFDDEDHNDQDEEDGYHDDGVLDSQQNHPLLQIPCAIRIPDESARSQPIRTFLDTGAQRTVMSWDCAEKAGLLQHLDRRYAGQAMGVGSCRVLGRIPAGIGRMTIGGNESIPSPAITILESTIAGTGTGGVELLLGLDFLRDYQAILNLRSEELQLRVDNRDVRIPFIRPRGSSQRGGAVATTTSRSHTSHTSSSRSRNGIDSADTDADADSSTRRHRQYEWESEEEDESEDDYDIDMSGV
jgi:hypothetical protein